MPIFLTNDDIKQLVTPQLAIDVMKETYRSIAEGTAVTRTRSQTIARTTQQGVFVELRTMDGIVPSLGAIGMRVLPDLHRWVNKRYDKIPKKNGKFLAFDLIFDLETADLQAVVQDAYLQKMRIAGTHGAAADYLARKDATRVGIIGSGWLAEAVLIGLSAVRSLKSLKVFSLTPASRERFARLMEQILNLESKAVGSAEEASNNVDIMVVCTNSIDPVYFSRWLMPGLFLTCVSGWEVDDECYLRSDFTVVSMREGRCNEGLNFYPKVLGAAANDVEELAARFSTFTRPIDWNRYPELGEVILGKARSRDRDEEITFFSNNVGFGAQFAALGGKAVTLARERGLGKEFSIDHWYQEVR